MIFPAARSSGAHRQLRLGTERGVVAILTAVSLGLLLTMAALTFSASFAYDKRNVLHAAADAAAKSAATELLRDSSLTQTQLKNFADQQVNLILANGTALTAGACGSSTVGTASVCVYHPPGNDPTYSGSYATDTGYVEVVVQEPTRTFFGFSPLATLAPLAKATAGAANPTDCLITQQNLTIQTTHLAMEGCGVAVGGDLSTKNSSQIWYDNPPGSPTPLPPVSVTGTCSGAGCDHINDTDGAPTPSNPLAGLPPYTSPTGANCAAGAPYPAAVPDGTGGIDPGCYSTIPNTVTTFRPGNFYITGTINVGAAMVANNVMLYLAGSGTISAPNSGGTHSLTVSAPTSGTYEGIAIFVDPSNFTPWNIQDNNFTLGITGVVYAPTADMTFTNALNLTSTGCTIFIVNSLSIANGNGELFKSQCAQDFSGAAFLSVSLAE